jgi:hypothetical protein
MNYDNTHTAIYIFRYDDITHRVSYMTGIVLFTFLSLKNIVNHVYITYVYDNFIF